MIDKELQQKIFKLQEYIQEMNALLADLKNNKVEVKISYTDNGVDKEPRLTLWRATAHVDYLIDGVEE